jgi:hypothetical protein
MREGWERQRPRRTRLVRVCSEETPTTGMAPQCQPHGADKRAYSAQPDPAFAPIILGGR